MCDFDIFVTRTASYRHRTRRPRKGIIILCKMSQSTFLGELNLSYRQSIMNNDLTKMHTETQNRNSYNLIDIRVELLKTL